MDLVRGRCGRSGLNRRDPRALDIARAWRLEAPKQLLPLGLRAAGRSQAQRVALVAPLGALKHPSAGVRRLR